MLLILTLLTVALPPAHLHMARPVEQSTFDDDVEDSRPQVKALKEQLLAHTKKRGEEDGQAIQIIT
ncbi:MAG: hypothetical protein OSB14_11100, partial [Planctomycetota bacterium]|nr:hypothetical protein [Planctomycetota bacterium]